MDFDIFYNDEFDFQTTGNYEDINEDFYDEMDLDIFNSNRHEEFYVIDNEYTNIFTFPYTNEEMLEIEENERKETEKNPIEKEIKFQDDIQQTEEIINFNNNEYDTDIDSDSDSDITQRETENERQTNEEITLSILNHSLDDLDETINNDINELLYEELQYYANPQEF